MKSPHNNLTLKPTQQTGLGTSNGLGRLGGRASTAPSPAMGADNAAGDAHKAGDGHGERMPLEQEHPWGRDARGVG